MENNLQVLLSSPQLFVKFLHPPAKLIDFVIWVMDDGAGCRLKSRDEDTQIKILSFLYSNHKLFFKTGIERYLASYASDMPCPSHSCLILAKNILIKWVSADLLLSQETADMTHVEHIHEGIAEINSQLCIADAAIPPFISKMTQTGFLSTSWRVELPPVFPSSKKRLRSDSCVSSTGQSEQDGPREATVRPLDRRAELSDGLEVACESIGTISGSQVTGGHSSGPKRQRTRDTSPDHASESLVEDDSLSHIRSRALLLRTDISSCAQRIKIIPPSLKDQVAVMSALCSLLDAAMEVCLSPTGTLQTSLSQYFRRRDSARGESLASTAKFSGMVLLVQCLRGLSLHLLPSDEVFMTLVDAYTDSNERSMQHLPLFLTLVVLPRFRSLAGPVSRVFMKMMELLTARCAKELIRCVLGRSLMPLAQLAVDSTSSSLSSVAITECGFQLECIHRMHRQGILKTDHMDMLLGMLFADTVGCSCSLFEVTSAAFESSDNALMLADSMINMHNNGPGATALWDLLFSPSAAKSCFLIFEFRDSGTIDHSSVGNDVTLVCVSSAASVTRPAVRPSPASAKALCAIALTSLKTLSVSTLQGLVSFLDVITAASYDIATLPVIANVLHVLITSHPNLVVRCRDELQDILGRSPSVVAKNTLGVIKQSG